MTAFAVLAVRYTERESPMSQTLERISIGMSIGVLAVLFCIVVVTLTTLASEVV